MTDKFAQFMRGRYGSDSYNRFLTSLAILLSIANLFLKNRIVTGLTLAILFYAIFRMLSRQIGRRTAENDRFLRNTAGIRRPFRRLKNRLFCDKNYKYFSCENCKAELRVPRNKGKIKVRCPKCKHEMTTKS